MEAQANPARFIDPIPRDDLERAANNRATPGPGGWAPFPPALEQAEMAYVHAWRRQRGGEMGPASDDKLVSLALYGGEISSATFALGTMQALAIRGLL